MSSNRIIWIDLAKALGIFLVVVGHVLSHGNILYNWIYSFHMPFFFFLSGFCFSNKYSYPEFIKRKFKSLIIPYLCLGLIVSILSLYLFSFNELVNRISHNFFNYGAMWFLIILFFTEIIFYPLSKINNKILLLGILLLSFTVGCLFYYFDLNKTVPLSLTTVFAALFFYGLGFLMSKGLLNKLLNNNYKYWIFIGLVVLHWSVLLFSGTTIEMLDNLIPQPVYNGLAAVFGLLAFCFFCYFVSLKLNKGTVLNGILYVGQNTLVILCFHMLFIGYSVKLIKPIISSHVLYKGVEFAFIWLACFVLMFLINRLFPWMINKKKAA